ncbi:MAG: N-acetylneuraminate synthase family protein [Lachnospiraceae bacterium]|nr:N-acetylneuraminate synthase family protein [Lachnospiraceae bacterium]
MVNMKINDFLNGKRKRYIIAEVSQYNDGSLGQAHAFIDAVAKTGADAIKFQTHIAEEESTLNEPFRVKFSYCDNTRYDYWKRMEFTQQQWKELCQHAIEKGLDFLSSPFSIKALEMLDQIGVPAWKFGSGEVFNDLLLKRAMQTGKPIILSTGLSTFQDIDRQVHMINESGNPLIIMECTTAYPSRPDDIPIATIPHLLKTYDCHVGISDHSATVFPSLAAVALGADVVEVHVTMSREMFGPDVKASVTMDELREIVCGTDFIQTMLTAEINKNSLDDNRVALKNIFSKSIYARKNLFAGDILSDDTMVLKKPFCESGILVEDYEKICGKKIKNDIAKDSIISWKDVEE